MKKTAIIATLILSMAVVFIGCKDKRSPGSVYMPDMAYSRAYESYAARDSSVFTTDPNDDGNKIFFIKMQHAGTIKRGEFDTIRLFRNYIFVKLPIWDIRIVIFSLLSLLQA